MMCNTTEVRSEQLGRNILSVYIAKIYIFCLTIKMIAPLESLQSIIGSAALSFDIIPHCLGILILLVNKKGRISFGEDDEGDLLSYFIKMVIWFIVSSVIMSVIIQQTYGNLGNESAYRGIVGMILYWLQYALILFYNYHVFRILYYNELERILQVEIILLMVIGYYQMAIMTFGGALGNIYDRVDFLNVLRDSQILGKLPLTGYEGAYTGYITGTLVLPYIYARNLSQKSKGVFLYILFWLPLIYMSFSTNAYILFSLITLGYLYYLFRTRGLSKSTIVLLALVILIVILVLLLGNDLLNVLPEEIASNIRYILVEKIQDDNNGSTVLRSLPFYYNFGAFSEYPILGVGNGLQGYFLEKYLPASFKMVKGIDTFGLLKRWSSNIANGSLFWPGVFSGYGLVGAILIMIYIVKSERLLRSKQNELGTMYYMYRLSIIGIIFSGFATEFVAKYYVWFAISIPLMPVLHAKKIDAVAPDKYSSRWKYLR